MRVEQLLQPDALEAILSASYPCWPGGILNDERFAARDGGAPGGVSPGAPARRLARGLEPVPPHSRRPGVGLRVLTVQREPLAGGVSGAHLERVLVEAEVEPPARRRRAVVPLIFKRLKPDESWLMRASGDTRCREVQLWQQGLLADLPRALCVPVLAAAYDDPAGSSARGEDLYRRTLAGEGREGTRSADVPVGRGREGALLLADVGRWLGKLEECYTPVAPERLTQYLDHLARLHAHYWEDARLKDARFALASVEQTLLMLAPAVIDAQRAAGDTHPYLPVSQAGWKAFFTHGPPDALARLQRVFAAPAALLASAAQAPATLAHGDAWPANMGTLPGERGIQGHRVGQQTILIDWALATAGPATFDPFWLLFACRTVDTRLALLAYRARLTRHLARRGIALDTEQWRLLVDLGVVRTVMTCGETMGQDVLFAKNESQRAKAIASLGRWTRWAARVIARRGWDQ